MLPLDAQEALDGLNALRKQADAAFARVAETHAELMGCGPGCDDCCHAVFDLFPVEAFDLAAGFAALPRLARREALRRADKAAKAFDDLARAALAAPAEARPGVFSRGRIACPLLDSGRCLLYQRRPLTCRLYGAPLNVGGDMKVCARARFRTGQTYPAVDVAAVQAELNRLSGLLARAVPGLPTRRLDVARALRLA